MGKVILFPSNDARRQSETENDVRDLLNKLGVSKQMSDAMLTNMKEFLSILKLEYSITVEGERDAEQIRKFLSVLQERNRKLLFERLIVEKDRCLLLGLS